MIVLALGLTVGMLAGYSGAFCQHLIEAPTSCTPSQSALCIIIVLLP